VTCGHTSKQADNLCLLGSSLREREKRERKSLYLKNKDKEIQQSLFFKYKDFLYLYIYKINMKKLKNLNFL
jgi:hypothetical protein